MRDLFWLKTNIHILSLSLDGKNWSYIVWLLRSSWAALFIFNKTVEPKYIQIQNKHQVDEQIETECYKFALDF